MSRRSYFTVAVSSPTTLASCLTGTKIIRFLLTENSETGDGYGSKAFRKQIDTVVGPPIAVPKIANPTQEQIDEYHQRYIDALQRLFDEHKVLFGLGQDDKLIIH